MITLTPKAVDKVKEIRGGMLAEESDETRRVELQKELDALRVRVIGGGCSGFSYDLFFEHEISDLDQVFEQDGVKVYVDMMSLQYLEGTEIDYVEGLHGAGFKFQNPQARGTCGCGSSFSV